VRTDPISKFDFMKPTPVQKQLIRVGQLLEAAGRLADESDEVKAAALQHGNTLLAIQSLSEAVATLADIVRGVTDREIYR